MSFNNYENSRTKGEPITLYHFAYVNEQQFFYTDAETEISLDGFDAPFVPESIQHGAIRSSGSLDKAPLEIRVPRTSGLADGFRAFPPNEVVNVVIRQMHLDDPSQEALVVWAGRVMSAAWEVNEIRFTCEPVSTSMKRTGLRRHYQLGCPHVLYGTQCLANRAAATTPGVEVMSISGSTITLEDNWLPSGWAAAGKTPAKFVGGLVTWTYASDAGDVTIKRTVLRITGSAVVHIAGPTTGLEVGADVQLVLGCNHQMTDCQTIHNNITNFGGQPFIPIKNPFGFSNNFY